MEQTNENVGSPAAPAASAPATEQVSATANPAPEGTAPEAPQPDKPTVPRIQKRIDQLTKERYDEQRRADDAEARLAQIQRQQAISQQFSQIDAQQPDISRFNDLASYNRAMSDWTAVRVQAATQAQWEERQQAERAHNAQQYAQMAAQQQRIAAENAVLDKKLREGTTKYADFHDAVMNPDLPSVRGTPLMGIILETDNAVDIAYSLAKNPGELERLLSLPPERAAREVNRMDMKFAGNGPTNAPAPPPQRNGSAQITKDYGQMSTAEHVKAYRASKRKTG